jgi:hypothetical protein
MIYTLTTELSVISGSDPKAVPVASFQQKTAFVKEEFKKFLGDEKQRGVLNERTLSALLQAMTDDIAFIELAETPTEELERRNAEIREEEKPS